MIDLDGFICSLVLHTLFVADDFTREASLMKRNKIWIFGVTRIKQHRLFSMEVPSLFPNPIRRIHQRKMILFSSRRILTSRMAVAVDAAVAIIRPLEGQPPIAIVVGAFVNAALRPEMIHWHV